MTTWNFLNTIPIPPSLYLSHTIFKLNSYSITYKNATYVSVLYNDNAPDTGFDSQQLLSFFSLHCLKHQMPFKNIILEPH